MNKNQDVDTTAKPFLRWAGGKRALLPVLLGNIPREYNNYYEPFLGGGTLYFALTPKKAYLSDLNEELVNTFQQIKVSLPKVVHYLKNLKSGSKKEYKRIRDLFSVSRENNPKKAAIMIYLNKTAWNGLYRVNKSGGFNVPRGERLSCVNYDYSLLKSVSHFLQTNAEIVVSDFEKATENAQKDDFIYFDPPYVTSHKNNGFLEYNQKIFSFEDQERLVHLFKALDKKGCRLLMSNADHDSIIKLYKDFNIQSVSRQSLIAGDVKKRKKITEIIIKNF